MQHRILSLLAPVALFGAWAAHASPQGRREVVVDTAWAARTTGPALVVDGRLTEDVWTRALPVRAFWQYEPRAREAATCMTDARVAYDDRALYVGMRMLNPANVTTLAPVLRRDDESLSDWVFAELDSRNDGRTAFSFGVNPRGSRVDGRWRGDGEAYEYEWNAVWQAAATIDSLGWTAELRIPFSQLPHQAAADGPPIAPARWGVSFFRRCARIGEVTNSTPRFPDRPGVVSLFGPLLGIAAPDRRHLEITPFVAARHVPAGRRSDAAGQAAVLRSSLGVEARLGLSSEFTLSTAVRPDFGQVEVDPSLINLSTFETFLPERRPLFTEGAELFAFGAPLPLNVRGNAFGDEAPFYSRRIGRSAFASVVNAAPDGGATAPPWIIASTKIAGRTSAGWIAGALNAVTGRETVVAESLGGVSGRSPYTSTTVLRLAREAKQGRAGVGFLATDVARLGWSGTGRDLLPENSRIVGVDARYRRAGSSALEVSGYLLRSDVRGQPGAIARLQRDPMRAFDRSDAPHLAFDSTRTDLGGASGEIRFARLGGSWTGALALRAVTPGFESNDAGFQRNADWFIAFARFKYESLRVGRVVRRWSVGSDQIAGGWSFGRERRAAVANVRYTVDFANRAGGGVAVDHELPALATEWLRGGPALLLPARRTVTVQAHSDARRRQQALLRIGVTTSGGSITHALNVESIFWARLTDRLELTAGPSWSTLRENWQFVSVATPDSNAGMPRYLVARLRQTSASMTLRATLTMTPSTSLQLYAQPFISAAAFDRYGEAVAPRAPATEARVRAFATDRVTVTDGGATVTIDDRMAGAGSLVFQRPDFNSRSMNATAVLRREFGAGSTAYFVVSQTRGGVNVAGFDGWRDVRNLLATSPATAFAFKVALWTEAW